MAFSLYNKYRPQVFGDVVGQEHVEKTLANAVENNQVSHSYLFCGPRGTGKTTTARILAKALLCVDAPTASPDGTCEHCTEISEGIHPDVYELDAASRTGVDNVREEIIGRVNFAPTHGAYKIYIIDEVHMLSTSAFNALLKTLEEPPPHVVFVLCTTDVHKVPDTVQARCQRFDFKHLGMDEIVGRLQFIGEQEGYTCESAALELIAARSQGGMRDAIRSLEQTAVFSGGNVTYDAAESLLGMVSAELLFILCDNLAAADAAGCFNWVAGYVQSGSDIAILVNDLATHVRNLYAVNVMARGAASSDEHLINALEIEAAALPRLRTQAALFDSAERLAWMLTVLGTLSAELKNAANARLALEVALTRMLYPQSETSLNALNVRVAALEAQLANGTAGATTPSCRSREGGNPDPSIPTTPSCRSREGGNPDPGPCTKDSSGLRPQNDKENVILSEAKDLPPATPTHTAGPAVPEYLPTDDQSLYRMWNSVVDDIKKKKRGLAANLGGIIPLVSKDDKTLTLELPAKAAASKLYLETDANQQLLRDTVAKHFGRPLIVRLTMGGESAANPSSHPEPSPCHPERSEGSFPSAPATPPVASASTPVVPAKAGTHTNQEPSEDELEQILNNSLNNAL